jgi:hypothetical protein
MNVYADRNFMASGSLSSKIQRRLLENAAWLKRIIE